ncbi:MAG: [FeFe] hydrogenase H-cluster radical SAM maturase HydE [Candidatus Kapabacteria bacterium]|nr:[FeFe] hydrogenase H-cluster radical SAM maturase HydE [Ignavibacteriota bacterium]MCW5886210.1 [FeFe] hydrogenase H-cluster radical SAM maturase HydE [Candidatus Kapabacteria bacterium]
MAIEAILSKNELDKYDIIELLKSDFDERNKLYKFASEIKSKYVGRKTFFRGLIEFSNKCSKNCLYCGIRRGNRNVTRYDLSDDEILKSVQFAIDNNYGSVVLQGGELENPKHTDRIESLIKEMMILSDWKLGITLSLGEQSYETYKKWIEAGAKRYLLRIESSNKELYYEIHPKDKLHDFDRRLECLKILKELNYQVGTGVIVGLPGQSLEHLADDLLFMKNFDIDMCGMGPYLEHQDTPLFKKKDELIPLEDRFNLTLKMISILRIMMKDINIAASTAMQSIDKFGREKALKAGANIIMPNITPGSFRDYYKLYENKPCTDEEADDCLNCMEIRITIAGDEIGLSEHGDSPHFLKKQNNN